MMHLSMDDVVKMDENASASVKQQPLFVVIKNLFHSRFHQFPLTLNDFEMRSKSNPISI